ncbi:hypothetical protein TRVL_07264 [Trypanosoma vivax]|nr:hypothetical protein TRVL_07264 [Trypanosoma vivax]
MASPPLHAVASAPFQWTSALRLYNARSHVGACVSFLLFFCFLFSARFLSVCVSLWLHDGLCLFLCALVPALRVAFHVRCGDACACWRLVASFFDRTVLCAQLWLCLGAAAMFVLVLCFYPCPPVVAARSVRAVLCASSARRV